MTWARSSKRECVPARPQECPRGPLPCTSWGALCLQGWGAFPAMSADSRRALPSALSTELLPVPSSPPLLLLAAAWRLRLTLPPPSQISAGIAAVPQNRGSPVHLPKAGPSALAVVEEGALGKFSHLLPS